MPGDGKGKSKGFDYGTLSDNVAPEVREAELRIKDFMRQEQEAEARALVAAIGTGCELIAMKDKLDHGQFLGWVRNALPIGPRKAERYMALGRVLGEKTTLVSSLGLTSGYRISARSTPEAVRAKVFERLDAGDVPTTQEINKMIAQAKRDQKRAEGEQLRKANNVDTEEPAETAAVGRENDSSVSISEAGKEQPQTLGAVHNPEQPGNGLKSGGAEGDRSTADPGGAFPAEAKLRPGRSKNKIRKVRQPELFLQVDAPAASQPEDTDEQRVRSETNNEEPVQLNEVIEYRTTAEEANNERKLFAERHARLLRRRARCRHFRIGRSIKNLAKALIPQHGNLDSVVSQRYQERMRQELPSAFETLKAYEEMLNRSDRTNE